jgi:hypothetical protein
MDMDEPIWDPTVFTKNRDRLLTQEIAQSFFACALERHEPRRSYATVWQRVRLMGHSLSSSPRRRGPGQRRSSPEPADNGRASVTSLS